MPIDCNGTALRYLEHREHSVYEVKKHLKSKDFGENEIKETIHYLEQLHYVDDERYCSDYLRYGMNKGKGPVRLQMELKEKGIDAVLIQTTMEEHFDRYIEQEAALQEALKILNRRGDPESGPLELDEKTMAKVGRKLAYLGYHTEVIYEIIGQLRKCSEPI